MAFNFENGSMLMLLTIFCSLTSLLWPLVTPFNSRLHHLGMLVHSVVLIGLLYILLNTNSDVIAAAHIKIVVINNFILSLKISKLGLIFATLIALLWPAAYFYSIGYLMATDEGSPSRFLFFLNLSVAWAISLSFAGDLLTMFIFYELLTLSTLPLVGHYYSTHTNKALKKYMLYLIGGSTCLWLPAILYLKISTGTLNFTINGISNVNLIPANYIPVLLCFFIFGITKAAIFPAHSWLPAAMAANYPTSAILHGALVVNTGVYVIYKILSEIFGLSLVGQLLAKDHLLYYLVVFGVIYAGIMAIFQASVKKILAWSTISYLNLMVLVALFAHPIFINLSVLALILHSFCKITLFFACGNIYIHHYATKLDDFKGTAKKWPLIFILFLISAFSLAGLTILFNGTYKKLILNSASEFGNTLLLIATIASTVLSLIYFGQIILKMASRQLDQNYEVLTAKPSKYMLYSTIYTAGLSLLVTICCKDLYQYISLYLK